MDLSHNFIEKLDNKTTSIFEDCLSLQEVSIKAKISLSMKCNSVNLFSSRQLKLHHNKISFITRKMFPSNPWVPYRLERLDLSHNLIPVLTFDLTFGTKKLKLLNVSYNAINEVRKFVLGNLTQLEVLDLSNNKLTNLNDPENPFELPENITKLYLQNNEIYRLNHDKILAAAERKLNEINLENNQLIYLNKSFIDQIKKGLSIRFQGNPLTCNCEIRSLKHFLLEQPKPIEQYSNLVCKQPKHVEDITLGEIRDQQLTCSELEKSNIEEINHDYEVLPDIRYRNIFL